MKNCKPKGLVPGGKYALGLAGSRANNELILMQERNRLAQDGSRQIISNLAAQQGAGGFGIGAMPQSAGGGMGAAPKVGIGVGIGGIGGEGGIPGSMARQIYEQNTNPAPFRNFSSGSPVGVTQQNAANAITNEHNSAINASKVWGGGDVAPGSPLAVQRDARIASSGGIGAPPPKLNWADSQKTPLYQEANAFPPPGGIGAFRRGGTIPGHDLKGKDNVPVKVTRGEAILPVKTVDALGGAPAIAQLIQRTNGKPPADALKKGGRFGIGLAADVDYLGRGKVPPAPIADRINAAVGNTPKPKPLPVGGGILKSLGGAGILAAVPHAVMSGFKAAGQVDQNAVDSPLEFMGRGIGQAYADNMPEAVGGLSKEAVARARTDNISAFAGFGAQPNNPSPLAVPTTVARKPPTAQPAPTKAQMLSDQDAGMEDATSSPPAIAQTDKQNFLGGLGIGAPGSTYKRMTQPEFNMNGGETYKSVDANGKTSYAGIGIAQTPEQLAQQTANDNARIFRNRNAMAEIDNRMYAKSIGNTQGAQAGLTANLGLGAQGIAQQAADTRAEEQRGLGIYRNAQAGHENALTAQLGQATTQANEANTRQAAQYAAYLDASGKGDDKAAHAALNGILAMHGKEPHDPLQHYLKAWSEGAKADGNDMTPGKGKYPGFPEWYKAATSLNGGAVKIDHSAAKSWALANPKDPRSKSLLIIFLNAGIETPNRPSEDCCLIVARSFSKDDGIFPANQTNAQPPNASAALQRCGVHCA